MNDNKVNVERLSPSEISEKGSLGLLALGSEGLRIWREAKVKAQSSKNNK